MILLESVSQKDRSEAGGLPVGIQVNFLRMSGIGNTSRVKAEITLPQMRQGHCCYRLVN